MNIRVTPEALKNQSGLVAADIKEIEKHWEAISDLVAGTRNYWEGEAAGEHTGIYNDLKDEISGLIKRLGQNPVKLQMMAGVYDAAETKAEATAAELPADVF